MESESNRLEDSRTYSQQQLATDGQEGIQLTKKTKGMTLETADGGLLTQRAKQTSEDDFLTAREKDDRTSSDNFLTAMATSKKSLSKSMASAQEATELRNVSQDRSRTYSGQVPRNTRGEIKMNINGTDGVPTTDKKTSQADNTVIDQFIYDTKIQTKSDSVNSDEVRERAKEILKIYNTRLKEEGEKSFQVRLNIFFTFVRDNSVEAEAYDMI